MDFFAQQDRARRNTSLLVLLFTFAVISLVVLTNIAVVIAITYMKAESQETNIVFNWDMFLDLKLIATVSAGVVSIVLLAIGFKWMSLAGGGKRVAESLGGQRIHPNTNDTAELRVLNIVEEMALASGMPVPPVYILKHETAINAFAAGNTPADAVIGVTRGCIHALDRDQLQGVIAHEFSHILNGDMRLNIRLIAVLHGIVFIGLIGEIFLHTRSNNRSKDGQALMALGVTLYVIGWLGNLFGQMIRATVSRQREYLADASAVQFTRNPAGIADALKVIGGAQTGTFVAHEKSSELSHMFFGQALASAFNTHPPLKDRILAVDPQWDGKYIASKPILDEAQTQAYKRPSSTPDKMFNQTSGVAAASGWAPVSNPQALNASLRAGNIEGAHNTLANLPPSLKQQARDPMGAMSLVFGLVEQLQDFPETQSESSPSSSPEVNSPEAQEYRASVEALLKDVVGLSDEVNKQRATLSDLPRALYVPLLEICFPALKCLSKEQYKVFKKQLVTVIALDKKIDLYEWCLFQLLTHYLDPEFGIAKPSTLNYKDISQIKDDYCLVLSMLAHEGHDDQESALHAFEASLKIVGLKSANLQPFDQLKLAHFSNAVNTLASCRPFLKANVIQSFVECIKQDGEITALEYEMLRSIAAIMDSPIPQLEVG